MTIKDIEDGVILFNNPSYESALIGVTYYGDRAIYDYDKMIKYLIKKDRMTEEEAIDFIDYNTASAHMTDKDPIIINRF
jgi:hypothetical protein